MNLIGIAVSLALGAVVAIFAYAVWFQPGRYRRAIHSLRQSLRRQIPALHRALLMDFFDRFPELEIVFARISTLLGLLVAGIGLYVSIAGPIVIHRGR